MDVHGQRCERLLSGALDGPTVRRIRFARFRFTMRQAFVTKAPGEVVLETRRRRITCHRLPLAVRLRYRVVLAVDGHVAQLELSDPEIQRGLETWLARAGGLAEIAGFRSVEQQTSFWPSERTLELLDLEGWRGEAAFLVANIMLIALRRYVAVNATAPDDALAAAEPAPSPRPAFRVHSAA